MPIAQADGRETLDAWFHMVPFHVASSDAVMHLSIGPSLRVSSPRISPIKPDPSYLSALSFISCAALLSSGSICGGPSLKSTLLIVPVKGNGTW